MSRRMSIGSALLSDHEEEKISPSFNKIAVRRSIGGRKSIGGSRRRSFGSPLVGNVNGESSSSPNQEAVREMYSKINDVIQLSSENKITQKNAWSLGVNVDSIMESALDEGIVEDKEKENAVKGEVVMRRRRSGGFARAGVNFQKASCKLDASVKIYSVRVDDTHASSYRILENLTRNSKNPDEDEDGATKHSSVGDKASSRKFGVANTLEKNPESLNCASSQDLNVDPSFHKMSHLFDEGGASGLLLYNLNLDQSSGCRIAFGDSDAGETEPSDDVGAGKGIIDISSLQSRVERAVTEVAPGQSLENLYLCDELSEFRKEILNSGYSASESNKTKSSCDDEEYSEESEHYEELGELPQDDDCENDYAMGGDGNDDFSFDDDNGMPMGFSASSPSSSSPLGYGGGEEVDIPLNQLDLMSDNEYCFFDMSRLSSNAWAGSNHWMLRKKRAQKSSEAPVDDVEVTSAQPKSKARKGGLAIDFLRLHEEEEEVSSRLVIPKEKKGKNKASSSSTELSTAAVTKSTKNSFLLPEDAGLKPSDLARLFLRPHKQVKGRGAGSGGGYVGYPSSPVDFAHDGDCDDSFGDDNDVVGYPSDDVTFVPFNMDDDVDESRMLAPERAVAKISVKHEIRAKKVDVRELKHQIWNDIRPLCESDKSEISVEEPNSEPNEEFKAFSDVMKSVGEKNNQEGVTLPFYFICVLHLANEKGLKLEGSSDLSDFIISSD